MSDIEDHKSQASCVQLPVTRGMGPSGVSDGSKKWANLGLDLQHLTPPAGPEVRVVVQGVLDSCHHRFVTLGRAVPEVDAYAKLVVLHRGSRNILHPVHNTHTQPVP